MRRRNRTYLILSLFLSAVLITILLSQVDIKNLLFTLKHLFWPALLLYTLCALSGALLRALRYRLLLKPRPPSFLNILWVTFIRNLFVDLLPARIGSLSYVYVVNKRLRFPFEEAASSFILAVLFDFLTLGPFLVLSLAAAGRNSYSLSKGPLLTMAVLFFLLFVLLIWKLAPFLSLLTRWYDRVIRFFRLEQKKIWAELRVKLEKTVYAVGRFETWKTLLPALLLSIAIRTAKYGALFFLLFALVHSHGYVLSDLSFFKTVLGTTGAEFTSVLPVKGLAGFGTWESAWALTFRLLGFDKELAVISGIGIHLITNIFEYTLGLTAILILAFPLLRRPRRKR